MSTRGTTYYDNPEPMDGWVPMPKLWCSECCTTACGCPNMDRLEAQRAMHYDGMGTE